MTTKVFINQQEIETDFFSNFNWQNFSLNEAVYLDDCNETDYLTASFQTAVETDGERHIFLRARRTERNLKSYYRVI